MTKSTAYLLLGHAWWMFAIATGNLAAYAMMFTTLTISVVILLNE